MIKHKLPYCGAVQDRSKAPKENRESDTELIVSSTAQGPAKNAIKIDVLLADSIDISRKGETC